MSELVTTIVFGTISILLTIVGMSLSSKKEIVDGQVRLEGRLAVIETTISGTHPAEMATLRAEIVSTKEDVSELKSKLDNWQEFERVIRQLEWPTITPK